MPFRFLLLRTRRIVPRATSRKRERGDTIPTRRRTYLGIVTKIPDQNDLIQASAHVFLLARGILDLAAHSVIQPNESPNRISAPCIDSRRVLSTSSLIIVFQPHIRM